MQLLLGMSERITKIFSNHTKFYFLSMTGRWQEVKYGTRLRLQCPVPTANFVTRQWYTRPNTFFLIYNQTMSSVSEGTYSPGHMLDTDTFELTINNMTEEHYIHTCGVTSAQGTNIGIILSAVYSECFRCFFDLLY